MTKDEAIQIVWDMVAERFVDATKQNRVDDRDEWLRVLDRFEREWRWLKQKRHDIPGLRQIPDNFPDEAETP